MAPPLFIHNPSLYQDERTTYRVNAYPTIKTLKNRNTRRISAFKIPMNNYRRIAPDYEELNEFIKIYKREGPERNRQRIAMAERKLGRPIQVENLGVGDIVQVLKRYPHFIPELRAKFQRRRNETRKSLGKGESVPIQLLMNRGKEKRITRELAKVRDLARLMKYQIKNTDSEKEKEEKRKGMEQLEKNMAARHQVDTMLGHLYGMANTDREAYKNLLESKRALKNEWYRRPPLVYKKAQATRKIRSASPRGKLRG